jgi:hypothetical protein
MRSLKADWTSSEQRAFFFYQRFSATAVFSSINTEFWTRIVPALCHHEPALRHAVFAIGELLETRYLRQRSSNVYKIPTQFAAIQYGKAMSCLRSWEFPSHDRLSGTAATALPLLACTLFICIEFMANNTRAAQIHIEQGRRLLAQFGRGPSPTAELVRRELVPIFTRLAFTFFFIGSTLNPVPDQLRWTPPPSDHPHVYHFETAAEAAQALYEIMDDILQLSQETRSWTTSREALAIGFSEKRAHIEMQRDLMLNRLRLWRDSFHEIQKIGLGHDTTALTARLYFHMMTVYVGVLAEPLAQRESAYDRFTSHFANVVVLAGHILSLERLAGESGVRFCFESGIIPPLNFTVVKCRHPHVRRSALALLQMLASSQHTENIWESHQVQHIAEHIMILEDVGRWKPVDADEATRDTLHRPADENSSGHNNAGACSISSQVPSRILPVRPSCDSCTCARRNSTPGESLCLKHQQFLSKDLPTTDVLAELVSQPVSGNCDPGVSWLRILPVERNHFVAAQDRIHTIKIDLLGEMKSSLRVFVHPDLDDPLTWGVYEEQASLDWVYACK